MKSRLEGYHRRGHCSRIGCRWGDARPAGECEKCERVASGAKTVGIDKSSPRRELRLVHSKILICEMRKGFCPAVFRSWLLVVCC